MEATPWLQLGEIGDVRIDVLPTLLMICRVGGGVGGGMMMEPNQ